MRILIAGAPGKFSNYVTALTGVGAQAVESLTDIAPEHYDGLLLPGGGDMDPSYYHEENRCCANIDPELDAAQYAALNGFVKAKKPVLGICRGHQLIHVYFGGSLIQEIPAWKRHVAVNKIDSIHQTTALEDSFIARLYGTCFPTNSSHHQAVKTPGKGMTSVQWSEHGTVVEASCHETLPVWTVQWHPERMCFGHRRTDTVDGEKLFRFFLEQTETYSSQNQETAGQTQSLIRRTVTLFSDQDEIPLSVLTIAPAKDIRGIFQLSHGMCEHKERYIPLMEYLAAQGLACIIHDHRGHGGSVLEDDDLGYMYGSDSTAIVEDLHQITRYAKVLWPGKKLCLMGHSMGSLVVRCYLKKYASELSGLIVCGSPSQNKAVGAALFITAFLTRLYGSHYRSPLITNLAFGPYEKRFPTEPVANCWLSANKDNVKKYNEDPLCGFTFTTEGYRALFHLVQETYSEKAWAKARQAGTCAPYDLPIRFIAGEEDPCIGSPDQWHAAMDFLKDQGYTHVSGKLFPHMRHEILNETDNHLVIEDVSTFLNTIL